MKEAAGMQCRVLRCARQGAPSAAAVTRQTPMQHLACPAPRQFARNPALSSVVDGDARSGSAAASNRAPARQVYRAFCGCAMGMTAPQRPRPSALRRASCRKRRRLRASAQKGCDPTRKAGTHKADLASSICFIWRSCLSAEVAWQVWAILLRPWQAQLAWMPARARHAVQVVLKCVAECLQRFTSLPCLPPPRCSQRHLSQRAAPSA